MTDFFERLEAARKAEADRRKEARAHLIELRDKQLSQFMEINAKGSIAILTTIFVVFVGASRLDGMVLPAYAWLLVGCSIVCAMGLLAAAVKEYSELHTGRIRSLQQRLAENDFRVEADDYQVIPRTDRANKRVFVGLSLLAVVAVAVFIGQAALSAEKKTKEQLATADAQCLGDPQSPPSETPASETAASPPCRQSMGQNSVNDASTGTAAPASSAASEANAAPAVPHDQ